MSIIDPKNDFARGDIGVQAPQTGLDYTSNSSVTLSSAQTSISSGGVNQTEQNMLAAAQQFQTALNAPSNQSPTDLINSLLSEIASSMKE